MSSEKKIVERIEDGVIQYSMAKDKKTGLIKCPHCQKHIAISLVKQVYLEIEKYE